MSKRDNSEEDHYFLPQYEVERINQFLKDVAFTMKLGGWDIALSPDGTDDENIAHIDINEQRHIARVHISSDWMQRSDEVKVNTLVHEVMHIAHHDLTAVVYNLLPETGCLPQNTFDVIQEATRLEAEKMCDFLAAFFTDTQRVENRWKELKKLHPKPKAKK